MRKSSRPNRARGWLFALALSATHCVTTTGLNLPPRDPRWDATPRGAIVTRSGAAKPSWTRLDPGEWIAEAPVWRWIDRRSGFAGVTLGIQQTEAESLATSRLALTQMTAMHAARCAAYQEVLGNPATRTEFQDALGAAVESVFGARAKVDELYYETFRDSAARPPETTVVHVLIAIEGDAVQLTAEALARDLSRRPAPSLKSLANQLLAPKTP